MQMTLRLIVMFRNNYSNETSNIYTLLILLFPLIDYELYDENENNRNLKEINSKHAKIMKWNVNLYIYMCIYKYTHAQF